MDKASSFIPHITPESHTAKGKATEKIVPPLNGSINLTSEAICSNGRLDGVALDAAVCNPSQEPSLVGSESSIEPQPQKVNGYTVTVNWIPLPAEEQKARRAELARIVAQTIVRLRRED